jgi:hypothetical protein
MNNVEYVSDTLDRNKSKKKGINLESIVEAI